MYASNWKTTGNAATGKATPDAYRMGAWRLVASWSAARVRTKKLAKKTPTATNAIIVDTNAITTAAQSVIAGWTPKIAQLKRKTPTIHHAPSSNELKPEASRTVILF